jgi:hypothetical protein
MVLQRLAAFSGAASHRRSMLHLSSEFLSNDIVLWGSLELCHPPRNHDHEGLRHPRDAAPKVNAASRPYAACPRWTIADRFLKPNRIREHEAVPKRHANRPNRLVRVSNSSLREVAVERCKPERVHSIEA